MFCNILQYFLTSADALALPRANYSIIKKNSLVLLRSIIKKIPFLNVKSILNIKKIS